MNVIARELLDVLFASLWQGACIALAVAAVLALTGQRLNAATRYVILQCALVAIAIVPLATTLPHTMEHASVRGHGIAGASERNVASTGSPATVSQRIDVPMSDGTVFMLTGLWIIGVLAFTVRIGAASLQLARLVRRSKRLADRCGVRVYASPDINVPLAIGFIVPSVIVPATLAAQSGEEFECIMLHELAHVRRGDAWVNACERALQALLFFSPAVMLALRAISLEREAACDDSAVAQSCDLDTYTRSLASFAVGGARPSPAAACGVSGFARATVTRIQRLEDARRNRAITLSHYALGGFTLMLAIIALTLTSFAPAIAFAPQKSLVPTIVASAAHPRTVGYAGAPPACADSNAKVRIKGMAAQPAYPAMARQQRATGTVLIKVDVDRTGALIAAKVDKSSRNAALDQSAMTAARRTAYYPAYKNCRAVAGSYLFEADYTGQ